jgi:hypothetical protein
VWRLLVTVLAVGSLVSCSANGTAETSGGLGRAKASGVEELPVPAAAKKVSNQRCESAELACESETWVVAVRERISIRQLRSWYAVHLPATERWKGRWEPCFDGRDAGPEDGILRSYSIGERLTLVLNGGFTDSGDIELTVSEIEVPEWACQ